MIDICVTELIKNPDPFKSNFGTRKWSEVLALGYFDRVHDHAKLAYEYMDAQGHHVPEIGRHGPLGITMSWTDDEDDNRIVTIVLEPNKFSYRWGKIGVALPTYVNEVQKLPTMLDLFSKYLNRTIEVKHTAETVPVPAKGIATVPFDHDKDRGCGCEKS
jgi:hypothetical protein